MSNQGIKVGCIMRDCVYNYQNYCMRKQIQINENASCLSYRKVYVPDSEMLGLKAKQLQSIGEDCIADDMWSKKLSELKLDKVSMNQELTNNSEDNI